MLVEEIDFEIDHFHKFWTSMNFTLTLARVIQQTIVYKSSTSIYVPNFMEIGKTILWTDRQTNIETSLIISINLLLLIIETT